MKRTLVLTLPIILLASLMLQPQNVGRGQQPADSIPSDLKVLIEKGKRLDQKQDKQNDSLAEIAMSIKPEKKVIVKNIPVSSIKKVAVRINGDVYEISPELYKGYALIDFDSLLPALALQSVVVDPKIRPEDIAIEINVYADERISFWQKIKNIFKSKK